MLSAKLQMRQNQSLVMTPQLLQSIRLLQFSNLELRSFIEAEMEKNPLIDVGVGPDVEAGRDAGSADAGDGFAPSPEMVERALSGTRSDCAAIEEGFEVAQASAPERADDRGRAPRIGSSGSGRSEGADGESHVEQLPEGLPSLSAHALAEIGETIADPVERRIAEGLVEHLDEAGYLRITIADFARPLGIAAELGAAVLRRVQDAVEPAGLFARDLAECLAIQLRRQGRLDPVMATILEHLDLLAKRDFAALRRLSGEDESGLMDILSEIRRLDPKPGHGFESPPADVVVPDVVVEAAADGGWRIELNPDALPRVLVHTDYVKRIAAHRLHSPEQAFVADCHASANWLVRSLDQRARTILTVATEIVKRQDGFLTHGIASLRPLTLMAVADAVGMHESTISRVTANKYMATPRGTFELKFFFTVAIASASGGDAHSAESVKHRIKAMVGAEGPGAVLSDDDIVERLRGEGIVLARRTVAKYREGLAIPSSIQRRRELNAAAPLHEPALGKAPRVRSLAN